MDLPWCHEDPPTPTQLPTRPSQHLRHLASLWRRPTPRSVQHSNPSHTATCSSAVCGTHHRRAGAAPDLAPSSTAVHAVTSPQHRPHALFPRCEVLDLRGMTPWRVVVAFDRQNLRTPPPTKHLLAHASTAHHDSRSSRRISAIITQDQYCSASNTTCAAPTPLGHPCTTARTRRFSLSCRTSHAVPTARGDLAACMASFFCSSGFPPFSWPAALSFYLLRAAPHAAPARMHARPFFLSTCFALRRAPVSAANEHESRSCYDESCPQQYCSSSACTATWHSE